MGTAPGLNLKLPKQTARASIVASELQAADFSDPNLKTQNDARGAGGALPVKQNLRLVKARNIPSPNVPP
jgi:hypothetical protein